jgi:uncharacterized protein
MLASAVALGVAIASIWVPALELSSGRRLAWWPFLLAIAIGVGLYVGTVTPLGAVIVAFTCLITAGRLWSSSELVRTASAIAGVLLAFGLAVRLFPGFPQVVFIDGLRLTPDASPMRLTAHFDAGVAGLVLMAFYCQPARTWTGLKAAMAPALWIAATTTSLVIAISCVIGYVRPEFKLPSFTVWHLAKMLLWTCVMEEAFFRGVLQGGLANSAFIRSRPHLRWLPLILASTLFGLAHAPGGASYVGLAALAGLGYGYAFQATGRIEAAMFAHFMLNATHFIGFTYPSIARG